jgi:nitrate/TMAO reductase-like tetraheme cytochrome c subunit
MRHRFYTAGLLLVALCGCGAGEILSLSQPNEANAEPPRIFDAISVPRDSQFSVDDFHQAERCGTCHAQHYREWESSAHANAMTDRVFQALVLKQRDDLVGADRTCTQCHSTIATRAGELSNSFSFDQLSPIALEGVNCESCHRVTAIVRPYNAGHQVDPAAPLAGPFLDAQAPHATAPSTLIGSAAFCGSCHDVQANGGLALESPFAEWEGSTASTSGTTCQDCHMPSYQGTAANLPGLPQRETLHRHWFTSISALHGNEERGPEPDQERRSRSEALLRSSAELSLALEPSSTPSQQRAAVTIRNLVDGHDLPTGASFLRELWLTLEVVDSMGRVLFESGRVHGGDELVRDPYWLTGALDPARPVVFGSTLRDVRGDVTPFAWRAARRDVHTLKPLESRTLSFVVNVPRDASYPLRFHAALNFRPFSPALLRALALNDLADELEVVEVATASLGIDADGVAAGSR